MRSLDDLIDQELIKEVTQRERERSRFKRSTKWIIHIDCPNSKREANLLLNAHFSDCEPVLPKIYLDDRVRENFLIFWSVLKVSLNQMFGQIFFQLPQPANPLE